MARKKRNVPRKPSNPRVRPSSAEGELPPSPDRRVLEGLMRELLGGLTGHADETAVGQAQKIVDQAFATDDSDERVALARKALEVSADCADAYVLLAENSRSRKEALELYQKGVEAGTRALGPELLQEAVGSFWGVLETRPLMRAKLGMAETLWTLGRRAEAVAQLQEMLRLNPNDNQGVRYTLCAWLLNLDRDEDLARLLDQFPDEGTAAWAYFRTLLAYRRHGDMPETRALLAQAKKRNRHIPAFLLGHESLPREQPPAYAPGSRSEAIIYTSTALAAWKATPGGLTWLQMQEKRPKARPPAAKAKAKGPTDQIKEQLGKLPQEFDVWQADCRQLKNRVEVAGETLRPWVVLVTSRSNDLVLAHQLSVLEPAPDQLWDSLAAAMKKPARGTPHRPSALEFRSDGPAETLVPHLASLGIECEAIVELEHLDFVLDSLTEHMGGSGPPGLLDMPGVGPLQVAGFYHAAASFYRRAPWRSLGYEEAIKIECGQFQSGPWYGVVMGQSGLTTGLALYEDMKVLRRLWTSDLSDEENARETIALTVTFDMETEIPAPDLEAARHHGWEVAGPEAHPTIFRKERGMSIRPPLAWELQLMEGCLRALPRFIGRHQPGDLTPHPMTVPTSTGTLDLVLSWIED